MINKKQLKSAVLKSKKYTDDMAVAIAEAVDEDLQNYATTEFVEKALENVGTGGGSRSNPDLNQNDETAPDYVKNRTHWVEPGSIVEILPETTIKYDMDGMASLDIPDFIEVGETYTIIYDGVNYECTAIAVPSDSGVIKIMGNLASMGATDTGEPFALGCLEGIVAAMGVIDEHLPHTIAIRQITPEKVHHIPPKYIKDMYYTEGEAIELIPETTITEDTYGVTPIGLKVGETYTINIDGVSYVCVAEEGEVEAPAICIGNTALLNGTGDTGEPFIIFEFSADIAAEADLNWGFLPLNESLFGSLFNVISGNETIHHIDPKYIKDMYYSEEGGGETVILPEAAFEVSEDGEIDIPQSLGLVVGNTYTVNCNGTAYECTGVDVSATLGVPSVALGNFDLVVGTGDTGEPFLFVEIPAAGAGQMITLYVCIQICWCQQTTPQGVHYTRSIS